MARVNEHRIARFFSTLFPVEDGFVEIRPFSPDGKPAYDKRSFLPAGEEKELAAYVSSLGEGYHIYFGVCTRTEGAARIGRGTSSYLHSITSFWADLDSKVFGDLTAARHAVDRFALGPSILVFTGHGFHAYWLLQEPISLKLDIPPKLQAGLKALQMMVIGGDDVSDLARILRVPYTANLKDAARPVLSRVVFSRPIRYPLTAILDRLPWKDALRDDFGTGKGLSEGNYTGLAAVMESDFIGYCRQHAATLSEPLWYAMITNLIGFRGGRKAIHTLSSPHPDYSFEETEEKIAHALRDAPGPHSYRYIAAHGFQSRDLSNPELRSPASLALVKGKR